MASDKSRKITVNIIRIAVLCIAAVFLYIGIKNGDPAFVLKKAAAICLECIGIG